MAPKFLFRLLYDFDGVLVKRGGLVTLGGYLRFRRSRPLFVDELLRLISAELARLLFFQRPLSFRLQGIVHLKLRVLKSDLVILA